MKSSRAGHLPYPVDGADMAPPISWSCSPRDQSICSIRDLRQAQSALDVRLMGASTAGLTEFVEAVISQWLWGDPTTTALHDAVVLIPIYPDYRW